MKVIKTIFKSIDVAFSIYSKIPMPRFEWDSEDMKYHMCFFPWVGAVIGMILYLWNRFCVWNEIEGILYPLMAASIPLLVTGGFHLDGYMDTMDALHSYQKKEKKLEILKDPHIGAFSVIMAAVYGLMYTGFLSEIRDVKAFGIICCSFFVSRCLSGISVMTFQAAKKNGMLNVFSTTAEKRIVTIFLVLELIAAIAFMFFISPLYTLVAVLFEFIVFLYYKHMSIKQFGGITGDLAGFFVCVAELAAVMSVSLAAIISAGRS